MSYLKQFRSRRPPQSAPVPNSAGGFAWEVDDWTRLRRFLILGSEGGSYYASEWKLTRKNAKAVERCVREDGKRAVDELVRVSREGRAPKNDPALFALALAAGTGDEPTRKVALDALPLVARTGTHLFQFTSFVEGFRGWGRSLRRAVGRWYAGQNVDALAYQAVKYRQREGVTHRDLLCLAHPAQRVSGGNPTQDVSDEHRRLFEWIVRGGDTDGVPRIVEGFVRAQSAETAAQTAALVREYRLPREALITEHLTSPDVWEALLEDMPLTAMIRNLATMTRLGVIAARSAGTPTVVERLCDSERIRRARVHPIALLAALRTYQAGKGARGRNSWNPARRVVDALDAAFYAAFANVESTGKVGAGLGRRDDVVDRQRVLGVRQRDVDDLGAGVAQHVERRAHGRLDSRLHAVDEVLARHAHAQATQVAVERRRVVRHRLRGRGRVARVGA